MANPRVVQAASSSCVGDDTKMNFPGVPSGILHWSFPHPCQAGNAIAVAVTADSGASFSVTDDLGNTYGVAKVSRGAGTRTGSIFVATNILAGTQTLTINGGTSFKQAAILEITDVSTVDTTSSGSSAGTAITAGTITPTQGGDFVLQVAWLMPAGNSYTAGPAVSDGLTYQLEVCSDPQSFVQIVQSGTYPAGSSTATTPTLRQSVAGSALSLAVAFKSASQGSDNTTATRILSMQHNELWTDNHGGGPGYPSPCPLHTPCRGDCRLVLPFQAGFARITAVSDNKGNTWQKAGPGTGATQHFADVWYAKGGVVGRDTVVTVTSNDITNDIQILFVDMTGIDQTNPVDTTAGQNGNVSTATPVRLSGPTISPTSTTGGLIFAQINFSWNTVTGMNGPTGVVNDATYDEMENLDGPIGFDQNGGYAHVAYAGSGSKQFVWNFRSNNWAGQNDYTTYAVAFRAAAAAAPVVVPAAIGIRNRSMP